MTALKIGVLLVWSVGWIGYRDVLFVEWPVTKRPPIHAPEPPSTQTVWALSEAYAGLGVRVLRAVVGGR